MQAEIKGTTMPILEVSLDPGEELVSTHGELAWMTPEHPDVADHDRRVGGGGGLMQGLKRMMGGGGLFLTRYEGPGMIMFAAKVPGHILPVDIERRRGLLRAPARLPVRDRRGSRPASGSSRPSAAACSAATVSSSRSWRARARPGSSCPGS